MTDHTARRIAADYLASLTDAEAAAFTAEARTAQADMRRFARNLFGDPEEQNARATRDLFGINRPTDH